MPKTWTYNHELHRDLYLTISLLYLLGCLGFDKTAVGAGLAICYYLLYRF